LPVFPGVQQVTAKSLPALMIARYVSSYICRFAIRKMLIKRRPGFQ
jgi:hypothetical protein